MLHINRTTKWATFAAVCLIVFAGSLRLVQVGTWAATDTPLACLGVMIYVGLLLGWGISLDHRLTDRRVKGLLFASIALMVLWFVLRCAKYDFFRAYDTVLRHLWYGYYIPMNFLPTLTFLAARSIGLEENRSLRRESLLLLIPDLLFTVMVLTNDVHQLVFRFQAGFENWAGHYTQLSMFFIMYAWMAAQYVGACQRHFKMSIFAEMECRFLNGSIQVLYSLIHHITCWLEARQALIYQLVSGLTGESSKYNYSKAVHLYPPFFDIFYSPKNYKIASALTAWESPLRRQSWT